jgi:hypothetical protein
MIVSMIMDDLAKLEAERAVTAREHQPNRLLPSCEVLAALAKILWAVS